MSLSGLVRDVKTRSLVGVLVEVNQEKFIEPLKRFLRKSKNEVIPIAFLTEKMRTPHNYQDAKPAEIHSILHNKWHIHVTHDRFFIS